MTRFAAFICVALLCALMLPTLPSSIAASKAEEKERARKAATAFREIMGAPDQAIPLELLDRSQCVGRKCSRG